jgi:hypothetical protein
VGIEHQLREAIVLGDLGVDADSALEAELAAELDIVEGDGVVGGLGPKEAPVSSVVPVIDGGCDLPRGEDVAV